jgi:hypothetical protein
MATVKEPTIQTLDVYIGRHLIEVEFEPEFEYFGSREFFSGFEFYDMWMTDTKSGRRRCRNISGYISAETRLDIMLEFNKRHLPSKVREFQL